MSYTRRANKLGRVDPLNRNRLIMIIHSLQDELKDQVG